MKVTVIKQFSVFLPNTPGALSRVAGLLAAAGVNVQGIASEVRDDSGLVRIAVEGGGSVSQILTKAGFPSVETSLLSVELEDRPGQLFKVAKALAEGRVNITTVYGTAIGGRSSRILFAVENAEKARRLLEALR